MNFRVIKALSESVLFLLGGVAVTLGAAVLGVRYISHYIQQTSVDVTSNFYMVMTFFLWVVICSAFQALLCMRLLWGKDSFLAERNADNNNDADDVAAEMKAMKITSTKKIFVGCMFLLVNGIGFDVLSGGVLLTNSYKYHVLTKLRSPDPQVRVDAVSGAIQLVGDDDIERALKRIIDGPEGGREWAAYAAGVRRDKALDKALARLLASGNERERAASAIALARLKDPHLVSRVINAWPSVNTLKGDLLIALGMVGKERTSTNDTVWSQEALKTGGAFVVKLIEEGALDTEQRRIAIWVLNRLESPEGLDYLESLLSRDTDLPTLCTALEALGNIGAAQTSPRLIELLYEVSPDAYCEELVATDFTGKEVLLASGASLQARIIVEIGHIGDERAIKPMAEIAKDSAFSDNIRYLAKEFVIQKQFGAR